MKPVSVFWWLTMVGYSGLLLLILLWFGWLSPPEIVPRSVAIAIMAIPLLLPLRGLLYGRPYTFAWTSFLALFYFIHGITEAYSAPEVRLLAMLEILFSTMLYTGAMLYARYRGRELKAAQEASSQE